MECSSGNFMFRLSIVVPIYNVEKYLVKCLNSVVNQLNELVEVILVDDGTKDNSGKICDEYALRFPNIKVVHKQNGGLSDARNFGIKASSGEYIAFLDGDDYISDNCIDKILKELPSDCEAIVYPFILEKVSESKHVGYVDSKSGFSLKKSLICNLSGKELWPAWKTIVKRSFIDQHRLMFPFGRIHEDVYWTSMVLLLSKDIMFKNIYWYNYIDSRLDSITSSIKFRSLLCMIDNFNDIKNLRVDRDNKKLKKALLARISDGCFSMLKCYVNPESDKNIIKRTVKENFICFKKSKKISHRLFCLLFRINKNLAFRIYERKFA